MGISTHILDTSLGRPAANVPVTLSIQYQREWREINSAVTDSDGRIAHLLPGDSAPGPGTYCIRFDTAAWFKANDLSGLYPYVEVVFTILPLTTSDRQHFHIPLLLTPYSYTTYRGS